MLLFAVRTTLPNRQYDHRIEEKEAKRSRTGEYMLLFGFVFVAAVITMAIIGPQIAQLMAATAGL